MADQELERAREHTFVAGVDDSGARLCEANVPYGLAKIHWAQKELGLPQDASFLGSPDCTITRNTGRWQKGFGYGGVYQWSGDFAVLDIKTNSCGMIVGALSEFPEHEEVKERLKIIEDEGLTLDGVPLDNDLKESNHFVDVLKVNEEASSEEAPFGAKYFFIMHSSGHEHRDSTPLGPGLYWDVSEELRNMARHIETPWGDLRILEGSAAEEWYQFYLRAQDFVFRRRKLIAEHLFGDIQVAVNATHQGLVRAVNQANVGCYHYDWNDEDDKGPLFPLTLSPSLPCYLVRGKKNLSDESMTRLGWDERMDRHGLRERFRDTNLLPHGGGYNYSHFDAVAQVHEDGPDKRRFELRSTDPKVPNPIIDTPRGMDYTYRGMEVKERMTELDLGETVVQLDLEYVLGR